VEGGEASEWGEGGGEGGDSPQYNPERKSGERQGLSCYSNFLTNKTVCTNCLPFWGFFFFFCLSIYCLLGHTHVLLMVVNYSMPAVSITRVILHVF